MVNFKEKGMFIGSGLRTMSSGSIGGCKSCISGNGLNSMGNGLNLMGNGLNLMGKGFGSYKIVNKKKKNYTQEEMNNEYDKLLKMIVHLMNSNTTTSTDQLTKWGNTLLGNVFKGVYSYDQAPSIKNNDMLIINEDDSRGPGVHWFGVVKHNDILYGYDSFGRSINKLIPKFKNKIINDTEDNEQNTTEFNCGQRALTFLLLVKKYGVYNALLI